MRLLLTAVMISCIFQNASPQERTYRSYQLALKSQRSMLEIITAELRRQQRSAVIELNGKCYGHTTARPSPARPDSRRIPSKALTNLLGRYGDFEVRKVAGDSLVVREKGVSQSDVDIILPNVNLVLRDRNDPNAAMEAVLTSDDVTSVLAQRRIFFVNSWEELVTPPIADPPIPPQLGHSSLETVIWTVLRAFPGVAVYQQCRKSNGEELFTIDISRY